MAESGEPDLQELFDHLKTEHNRVLSDVVYYQKCIELLEKYRKMFIIFNNNINDLKSPENQFMFNVLEDLEENYKKTFKEDNQITHWLRQTPLASAVNLKHLIKSFVQNGKPVTELSFDPEDDDEDDDSEDESDDDEEEDDEEELESEVDYQDSYVDIETNPVATKPKVTRRTRATRGRGRPAKNKGSPTKTLSCDWPGCEYLARDRYALTSHVRSVHTMERPFKCPICTKTFTREDKLKEHRKRHEKPDVMYRCKYENCKFETPHKQNLYSHETRHQNIRKFKCPVKECPMSFFHMSELRRHTNTVHSEARPYLCDWPGCEVTYKSRQLLNDHKRTHLGLREFKCDFEGCAKTFVTGKRLYSHKLQHTKPYVCTWPECGHRYGSNRELKAHMNRHQDVRPFNCPIIGCFHCFHSRPLLNAHLRDVHRTGPQGSGMQTSPMSLTHSVAHSPNPHTHPHPHPHPGHPPTLPFHQMSIKHFPTAS